MRDVNIADCENLFIKDEYRHIVFDEDDLLAVINGEYVVKTPSLDEESQGTPNKRVTWRESLEETFYEPEEGPEDCLVVDLASHRSFLPSSQSAPSSPVKAGPPRAGLRLPRSRSADRQWRTGGGRGGERAGERAGERQQQGSRAASPASPGHSHVWGDQQNSVRRVRCDHTRQHQVSLKLTTSVIL